MHIEVEGAILLQLRPEIIGKDPMSYYACFVV
jgi:hypothetical protein